MRWLNQKIKAASIQYVLVISVIILIVVSAFISLIYLQKKIALKSVLFKETIHHTNLAFDYLQNTEIPYNTETLLNFSDYAFESTLVERKHWGIFDVINVRSTLKNETFQKTGIVGGKESIRRALYLEDSNKQLVLVGNTKIKGTAFLPKRGVKRGSISGTSYYGTSLIYGDIQVSQSSLPIISNSTFLKTFLRTKNFENTLAFDLEDGLKKEQSFTSQTLVYESFESVYLQNISLKGNVIISSETSITVDASAVLENVILMAPEIIIQSKVKGSFQALATRKIQVKSGCKLAYPSALIVFEEDIQTKETRRDPVIEISENNMIDGVIVFKTDKKTTDYNIQVFIGEHTTIRGDVYCEKNLELKGTVKGSVYTGNFIAREYGGVYVNHIYNGVIDSEALPNQFSGLFINSGKASIAKWVY